MKKNTICLITGGRWHSAAYEFLLKRKFSIIVFDDNKNCYLKKKFKEINLHKIKKTIHYKNNFFWSPCNDLGSHLSDKLNKNYFLTRTENYDFSNNKKMIFEKLKLSNLLVKKIIKNKKYIKKPIFGSGSNKISLYNGKNSYDKSKFFLQEFIEGTEISVEIYSFNGYHKIISYSLRILKSYKSALCILSLDINKNLKKAIEKKVQFFYKKLKVSYGISHLELIIDKDKKIHPVDFNFRLGGAGVAEFLLKRKIKSDPFEIDFNTLKNGIKYTKFKTNQNGMLIYEYLNKNHLKKKLTYFKKMGEYQRLGFKKKITHFENDKNRFSMLYVNLNKNKNIKNTISLFFTKNKTKEFLDKIYFLKKK